MCFLRVQGQAQRREMAVPFQGVARQPCACKIAQSVPEREHSEGEKEITGQINIITIIID
ncbi:hypothetical protein [Nitrosomonas sp. Is37]|uniref:hypothetical protein n=1 Tax=Nitrosomonas sp. Is37 TaxID=3080535 RepID=UPI00294B2AED|nr:hypothetical protein [Nitrosomonas sp. Is37]MDV6344041.1 hypothetical protein [Nitrosomonas sp. Is37]